MCIRDSFQWFRDDGQPILHAVSTNTSVLVLTNAQPSDTAVYRVRVTNTVNSVTSDPASLTVNQDDIAPTLVAALGWADGTNILISFSEGMDTFVPTSAFHVQLTGGGGALNIIRAAVTNGTNILIATDAPRTANTNYSLVIDANVIADMNGNSFAGANIPLPVEAVSYTHL